MKKLRIIILCLTITVIAPLSALATDIPKPTSEFYVGDFAGVLTGKAKDYIINTNLNYEKTQEKPQVAVVTTDDISDSYLEEFAVKLFEEWKIGNRQYDNGVLLLLSLDDTDRGVRIEVGYGLEGRITDSKAGRILDEIMPDLKSGNYSEGLLKAFRLIAQEVNDEYGYDDQKIFGGSGRIYYTNEPEGTVNPAVVIILIIIGLTLLWADYRFLDGFILSMLLRSVFRGSRRGGGGGGFGGGSFGGGGRSGGGGASRRF